MKSNNNAVESSSIVPVWNLFLYSPKTMREPKAIVTLRGILELELPGEQDVF
jgi:hypothetical protein